jgi:hypothetical protein
MSRPGNTLMNVSLCRSGLVYAAPIALATGLLLPVSGCSSSQAKGNASGAASGGTSAGPTGGAGNLDGGVSPNTKVVGAFVIDVVPPVPATSTTDAVAGHTLVSGRVDSDSQPERVIWKVSASEGGCDLLVPSIPVCDSDCVNGTICSGEVPECRSYPGTLSVGTVTVSGLSTDTGPAPVTIESMFGQYQLAGVTLAYPPFVESTPVRLEAAGGDVAAFSMESRAVAPLELIGGSVVPMESGKPVTLNWVAPGAASQARIQVIVDISQHGGQAGEIDCDVPDTGSMVIPATLVTQLMALGIAGFPGLQVIRIASTSTAIAPGMVRLDVQSSVKLDIQIPGLISCTEDTNCPGGQTCQIDSTCQ